jgi:hypothetical protein
MPFEWIWDTSLSALLAVSLVWSTFLVAETPRRRNFALYGLLWGFCLLENPALGAVLPFLLVWVHLRTRTDKRTSPGDLLLVISLAFLVCLPWTIRNAVQFHRFIPIRSNLPFELWMGNNPIFDEHSREVNRITRYEQVHLYAQLGETAFLQEKWWQASTFIRTHPALSLQLSVLRTVAMWMGTPSPWQDFQRADSKLVRFVFLWNAVTCLGTLTGLACLYFARRSFFIPVAAFPMAFPIVYYLTQASLRLRHPCDPILALLIALAVMWPASRTPRHANEP